MHSKTLLTVSVVITTNAWLLASNGESDSDDKIASHCVVYHNDPQHLWNRLHEALWSRLGPDGRVYGRDRIDPLLWSQTRHLLAGSSRDGARQVLREFLDTNGERLIDEPLKRAMLQRDLWAVFDWLVNLRPDHNSEPSVEEAQTMLRQPLAESIGRLALTQKSIEQLPDTYADAVASPQVEAKSGPTQRQTPLLPPDLFDAHGPWVCVSRNGSDIVAPGHARRFSRSIFQVFLKLPEGRKATREYLSELSSFKEPFRLQPIPNDGRFLRQPNPALPQFPAGTLVALVRSAMLIDSELRLRATRIVESVQLRDDNSNHEFILSRGLLFGGKTGGLRRVATDERDFQTNLNDAPHDEFEADGNVTGNEFTRRMQSVLYSCVVCHAHGNTVQSFNTFVLSQELNPSLSDISSTARGETAAIRYKQTRYEWGLLEGLQAKQH